MKKPELVDKLPNKMPLKNDPVVEYNSFRKNSLQTKLLILYVFRKPLVKDTVRFVRRLCHHRKHPLEGKP